MTDKAQIKRLRRAYRTACDACFRPGWSQLPGDEKYRMFAEAEQIGLQLDRLHGMDTTESNADDEDHASRG